VLRIVAIATLALVAPASAAAQSRPAPQPVAHAPPNGAKRPAPPASPAPPVFVGPQPANSVMQYGLNPAPFGYRWVRSGNDLLLVNLSNGAVVDAAYGVFD
jgi:hypothetical protein